MDEDEASLDWDPDETTVVNGRPPEVAGAGTLPPTTRTLGAAATEPLEGDDAATLARMRRSFVPPAWLWVLLALGLGTGAGYLLFGRDLAGLGARDGAGQGRVVGGSQAAERAHSVRSRGALPAEEVESGVSRGARGLLQRCWASARAARDPGAAEAVELVLNLDIRDTGGVSHVEIVEPASGYPSLASCVRGEALRWSFPVATGETVARVALRFGESPGR